MPRQRRTRGTGEVYREPAGSWAVRWREDGRRRYKGGFPSKDIADRVLAKVRAELAQGRAGLPADPAGFPTLDVEAKKWIERRKKTNRAWPADASRWKVHLSPAVGHLRPAQVDAGVIRKFVEATLAKGYNPATAGHCVRLLSTFYSDMIERPRETGVTANPVRSLPRSTRRLFRPTHDPRDTAYVKTLEDVTRLHAALPEPVATAFAVGVFAGLRTGEVLGLSWEDLGGRSMRVRRQVQGSQLVRLKDDEPRTVPILNALAPVLEAHRGRTGGKGLLFRGRGSSPLARPETLNDTLKLALRAVGLPQLTWYQATRHTFASHWVIGGGSIERLALILGHSSSEVTRRYAHLSPDHLGAEDRARLPVRLNVNPASVQVQKTKNDINGLPEVSCVGQSLASDGDTGSVQLPPNTLIQEGLVGLPALVPGLAFKANEWC